MEGNRLVSQVAAWHMELNLRAWRFNWEQEVSEEGEVVVVVFFLCMPVCKP